jgi:hypothetical protein
LPFNKKVSSGFASGLLLIRFTKPANHFILFGSYS